MRCLWGGCRRRLSSHSVLDVAAVGERGSISPVVFGEVLVEGGAVLVRGVETSIDKTKITVEHQVAR